MSSHRTIYWPDPSWSATRALAKAAGVSLSEYIRMAVEDYSDEKDAVQPRGHVRREHALRDGAQRVVGEASSAAIETGLAHVERHSGSPLHADALQRGEDRERTRDSGVATAQGAGAGHIVVKPFTGPITKASQTRKRGKV